MNKLKKVLAGLLAVSCIISCTACGTPKNDGSDGKSPNAAQTADKVLDKAYQAIELDLALDVEFDYVELFMPLGNTGKLLISGSVVGTSKMYVTDTEFSECTEIPFDLPQPENGDAYSQTAVTPEGNIMLFVTTTDYGDFEMPDYDDPDFDYENYDYEALSAAAQTTYSLYIIDSEGNVISDAEVTGLEKFADLEDPNEQVYISEFFTAGEDKAIAAIGGMNGYTYVTIDMDGKVGEKLDLGDDYFYPTGMDKNGNFVFMTYEGSGSVIKTFDVSTMSLSKDVISLEGEERNFNSIMRGSGDYEMYLSNGTSLYGLTSEGTLTEIINWVDSDITGDSIQSIVPIENEEFLVYERDWSSRSASFYRLTKRDASELENVKVLNMVVAYANSDLTERVKNFNKTNSEYRIKVEDYSKYYVWDEETQQQTNSAETQLKQDIAAGKTFDIIAMDGSSTIYTTLANKGAMVDLYELMGKDGTVAKEDIVAPVLSAGEVNGKLVSIAPSFYLTTLAAKTKYCDKENWTIDDVIETYDNLPEGMKLFADGNTKMDVFGTFIFSILDFIDYANGTCSFDSPDFIKILEFCNKFYNEGEGDEIDWETATDDEMQEYWEESQTACRNDKALVAQVYFDSPRTFASTKYGQFGDDITLVGYPSVGANINTSNSYGIMASSENKDVCWKFISSMFDEDFQESDRVYAMPARVSSFEKRIEECMSKPYYMDSDGKKVEYDDSYYLGGESIDVPPLTKEEADYMKDYILNSKASGYIYDETVFNIVQEELESYFAGEKSAEQAAEVIQNRLSILVSEQF